MDARSLHFYPPRIEELKSFISEQESSKIIILCNKCDIEENISKVEALELTIKELADNAGKSAHWIADPIRFSAKTGKESTYSTRHSPG